MQITLKKFGITVGAIALSYLFIFTMLVFGQITGFLPEYNAAENPTLFPSQAAIMVQYILSFTLIGLSLAMVWNTRRKDYDAHFAIAYHILYMTFISAWPYLSYGIESFVIGYSIIVVNFIIITRLIVILRQSFTDLNAALLTPVLIMNALYLYSSIHGHILNPI